MILVGVSSQGFRQARSVFDFFAQFNFTIDHVTGTLDVVADALLRRPGDEDPQVAQVTFHRCTPSCASRASRFRLTASASLPGWAREPSISDNTLAVSWVELAPKAKREIQQGYCNCSEFSAFWRDAVPDNIDYVKEANLLFIKSANKVKRLCIPTDNRLRTRIIAEHHDSPIAAHPGNRRTFLRTARWYY